MAWLRPLALIAWLGIFVTSPRATAAITLLVLGGAFMAFNAMIFWATVIRRDDAPAIAPLFGGILAAVGVALLPFPDSWKWAWVPLVLDWGGLPLVVVAWSRRRSR
jgi:hypothetical protein